MQMEVQRQFMLPPTTTPAYSSSSANNQLAFPPLTPASGMSTQELRVPTTYHAGSHTDQRGTPSGTNALNAIYASSEDRHPRQQSGSEDRYHREYDHTDDRHRHESGSMSSSLSSSQPAWQSRPGQNYPEFPGSRVVPAR